MSITFFLVGGLIFATYMYFTIWNIFNSQKEPKRKSYPNFGSEGCEPYESKSSKDESNLVEVLDTQE